jgi:hypothetical protein
MLSCRPFHDSLIISTYEINTFYISLQPWRGVFGSNLFSKLDKVCVNHRKKCLKTADGKSRLDIAEILLNQSIYRLTKGVSRIRKLKDRQCIGQKLQDNNGIIKIQNRIRQAAQVREYRRGINKRTIQRKWQQRRVQKTKTQHYRYWTPLCTNKYK